MRNKKSNVQVFSHFKTNSKIVLFDAPHLENQSNQWESPEGDILSLFENARKCIQEKTNFYDAHYIKTPHGLIRL